MPFTPPCLNLRMSRSVFVRLICLLLAGVVACGDDGAPDRYVTTGGDGDGDGDADSDDGGGDGDFDSDRHYYARFCTFPTPGNCTEAEYQPIRECLNDFRMPRFMECRTVCGSYIDCLDACDCADRRCVRHCEPSVNCGTCFVDEPLFERDGCEELACSLEIADSSCADLEPCCVDLSGELRVRCEQTAASDDLMACSMLYWENCGF